MSETEDKGSSWYRFRRPADAIGIGRQSEDRVHRKGRQPTILQTLCVKNEEQIDAQVEETLKKKQQAVIDAVSTPEVRAMAMDYAMKKHDLMIPLKPDPDQIVRFTRGHFTLYAEPHSDLKDYWSVSLRNTQAGDGQVVSLNLLEFSSLLVSMVINLNDPNPTSLHTAAGMYFPLVLSCKDLRPVNPAI